MQLHTRYTSSSSTSIVTVLPFSWPAAAAPSVCPRGDPGSQSFSSTWQFCYGAFRRSRGSGRFLRADVAPSSCRPASSFASSASGRIGNWAAGARTVWVPAHFSANSRQHRPCSRRMLVVSAPSGPARFPVRSLGRVACDQQSCEPSSTECCSWDGCIFRRNSICDGSTAVDCFCCSSGRSVCDQ
jgi:hypothetical protein